MPFRGGGALYRTASKLAHACHGANVHYEADPARGVGVFTALRDIQQGCAARAPARRRRTSLAHGSVRRPSPKMRSTLVEVRREQSPDEIHF